MRKIIDKNAERLVRHARVRTKISGTSRRPRLSVYRSTNEIYCQVIDDEKQCTLVSASSKEKALAEELKGKTKTEQARLVGSAVAKKALSKKIKEVVFDRGGYVYTGRVKAVAEGARDSGLKI
ncbi:MAG: 50S ribosomal protein L18 [Clostridiales bacterium]|nr:50S ribosomal protein L18 [Candidatus Apopatousia equi]